MPDEYSIGRFDGGLCVYWWEDGKRRRFRLEASTRAEAAGEAPAVVQRERAKKSKGALIGDLWEAYRKEKAGKRVVTAMEFEWRKMKAFFGHLTPEQVTIDLCRAYADARRQMGMKDGTIWTELGHLRTVLVWAVKRRYATFAPPIERPQKPAPKDRWLTRAEAMRLIEAAKEPHIKLAIRLMLETAGRVGAILELKWERVDLEGGHINLRTTEAGVRKGRAAVPINEAFKADLATARANALTDFVIEWGGNKERLGSIKTGFQRAVRDAGLVDVTPHTLRHTAAVHMAVAGRPMSRISQYLGHSSTHVTEKVYARFAPDHLREEAAVLDFSAKLRVV